LAHAAREAHARADAQQHAAESDSVRIRSAYAPKTRHKPPAQGADVASPDPDSSIEPARPQDQHHKDPVAGRRGDDRSDLRRLEATLRSIEREEAAMRIPRAAQLAPVLGLACADIVSRPDGDEGSNFRLPRSLEPERMAPPPSRSQSRRLRASLILLLVGMLGAPSGYYLWTAYPSSSSQPVRGPQTASVALKGDGPPSAAVQRELPRTTAQDDDRAILIQREESSERPESLQLPSAYESEAVAMLEPSAPREQAMPSGKASRVLDPDERELLMKQGQQLIAAGDVATARTVLQRAADAGEADAAMALGGTYDPNVLARLGVLGVSGELEKARSWYQRAETLGSPDARRRLDLLANH
jgi:hypothetical protein